MQVSNCEGAANVHLKVPAGGAHACRLANVKMQKLEHPKSIRKKLSKVRNPHLDMEVGVLAFERIQN